MNKTYPDVNATIGYVLDPRKVYLNTRVKQLEEIIKLYESHIESYFGKSCVERLREKTKKELEEK